MDYKIIAGGVTYISENDLREALGIVDEHVDLIGLVRKLKEERDELKEKCDKLKKQTNAAYGSSCGYSGSKAPEFRCNVISYSWELGPIEAHSLMDEPSYRVRNDSIRVELELTPTANYKGAFDLEDLKHYIQAYGREKKLGIIESVDYQNAKAARAELAYLYKQVLGKERLDRDLSPHEVMKAILDEYKKVRDSARLETRCEVNDHIDELCDKYNVVQPEHSKTTRYKYLQEFRDSIYKELGIPRYGYTLTEAIDELKKRLDRYARFRSRICTALCLGGETSDEDILNAVEAVMERATELQFNTVDKDEYDKLSDCRDRLYEDYTELRKAIWEAMDRKPETLPEENARLVGEVRMLQLNDASLKRMHTELRKAIDMDYPVTNNDIINRVKSLYDANESNCDVISDLNRQVAELARGEKLLIEFRDAVANAIGMDYPTTNQVILNNVQYIYKDRGDAYDIVAKLNDQVKELEKAKDDLQQKFLYQSGLRQQWHVRYESEHERANGEHKRAEKALREVETLKRHRKILENDILLSRNEQVAVDAFRNECRKLKEEKTKVISALGQDIWDDCVK